MYPQLLLVADQDRLRAYPNVIARVRTTCGPGVIVYATDDGWLGVRLDGERRVDEYPARECARLT